MTATNVVKELLNGERTLAEIEGMTGARAAQIAQVGCDFAAGGRFDEARVIFEGLTAMNPKDVEAHTALGSVYWNLDCADLARREFDTAISLNPMHIGALFRRAELKLRMGDMNFHEDFERVVKADPQGTSEEGRVAKRVLSVRAQPVEKKPRSQPRAR